MAATIGRKHRLPGHGSLLQGGLDEEEGSANGDVRNAPKKPLMAESAERVTTGAGRRAPRRFRAHSAPEATLVGPPGRGGLRRPGRRGPGRRSLDSPFQGESPFSIELDEVLGHDGDLSVEIRAGVPTGTQPAGYTDRQDKGVEDRGAGVDGNVFPRMASWRPPGRGTRSS